LKIEACGYAYLLVVGLFNAVTEIEGLKRKLTSKLGANSPALVPDWQVLLLTSYTYGLWGAILNLPFCYKPRVFICSFTFIL